MGLPSSNHGTSSHMQVAMILPECPGIDTLALSETKIFALKINVWKVILPYFSLLGQAKFRQKTAKLQGVNSKPIVARGFNDLSQAA